MNLFLYDNGLRHERVKYKLKFRKLGIHSFIKKSY